MVSEDDRPAERVSGMTRRVDGVLVTFFPVAPSTSGGTLQGVIGVANEPITLTAPADRERFAELEQIIERGFGTFVEVGRALHEIQQRRLYRAAGHRTFAEYVARRWDLSSAHAYRQIDAAKVVDILSPIGETPMPTNEAQARELARLVDDPEAVREIWIETIQHAHGRVTARAIREHVSARRPTASTAKGAVPSANSAPEQATCPACGHQWRL